MLTLVTAPAEQPLELTETKLWLRVDHAEENDMITELIEAATDQAEHTCNRAIITQTWLVTFDRFYHEMVLPKGLCTSVDWVKYLDEDEVEQTLSTSVYETDLSDHTGGRIRLKENEEWPDIGDNYNPVRIQFVAGIAADASEVPKQIKVAIKTHVAHMYENREELSGGFSQQVLPRGYDRLLSRFKIVRV